MAGPSRMVVESGMALKATKRKARACADMERLNRWRGQPDAKMTFGKLHESLATSLDHLKDGV
jgi:hypothetical protein